MALSLSVPPAPSRAPRRYLRPPVPLHFPVHVPMPEGTDHLELRMLLYDILRLHLGEHGLVSSDQFLYWDPTNPKRCLAPDVGVRVGEPWSRLKSWKIWELGAPQVGVEIASDSDTEPVMERKLEGYRQAGVLEVVWFDPAGEPVLRLWDLVDGDMVERDPADPKALLCDALGLYWCVRDVPGLGRALRLARDPQGVEVLPTAVEAARAQTEAERAHANAERAHANAAEARIAELEALLAKRDG